MLPPCRLSNANTRSLNIHAPFSPPFCAPLAQGAEILTREIWKTKPVENQLTQIQLEKLLLQQRQEVIMDMKLLHTFSIRL